MEHSLNELSHLYAINEVRLEWEEEAERWVSERSLWHDVRWEKGKDQLHRPDGELHFSDGQIVAIEVELSQKRPAMLSENLIELIRGEQYLQLKEKHGATEARQKSVGMESRYDEIWYFGPKEVRRQVMRERGKLLEQGVLSEEEANHFFVRWYPLASVEEQEQEEQEDKEGLVSWQKAVSQEKHRRTKTADRRRKKA
jgi:hypothetical protein